MLCSRCAPCHKNPALPRIPPEPDRNFPRHQLSCVWKKINGWAGRELSRVAYKKQTFFTGMPIDDEHITLMHLCSGHQSGNWVNDKPLDGSLQVARSIPLIGSFLQQELSAFLGDSK